MQGSEDPQTAPSPPQCPQCGGWTRIPGAPRALPGHSLLASQVAAECTDCDWTGTVSDLFTEEMLAAFRPLAELQGHIVSDQRHATDLGAVHLALDAAGIPRTSEGERLSPIARIFRLTDIAYAALSDRVQEISQPVAVVDPVPLVGQGPEGQRLWLIGHSVVTECCCVGAPCADHLAAIDGATA